MADRRTKYIVDIDFDEASQEWLKNKKKKPNGYHTYKCAHWSETKNDHCKNKVVCNGFCKYHSKFQK